MRHSPRVWSQQLNLRSVESRHGLPSGLLEALMFVETRGRSGSGDGGASHGLFQIHDESGGQELRDNFAAFRGFHPGVSPQRDAEAAATLFVHGHDRYISERSGVSGVNLGRSIAAYNAGAPRIRDNGYDAVSTSAYTYVPRVIAYLKLNGFEETAQRIIDDVHALPASEVDRTRFDRAVAIHLEEYRPEVAYVNRNDGFTGTRAAPAPVTRSAPETSSTSASTGEPENNTGGTDIWAAIGNFFMGIWNAITGGNRSPRNTDTSPTPNSPTTTSGADGSYEAQMVAQATTAARGFSRVTDVHWAITRNDDVVRAVQEALGIEADGVWGRNSSNTWREVTGDRDEYVSVEEIQALFQRPNVNVRERTVS